MNLTLYSSLIGMTLLFCATTGIAEDEAKTEEQNKVEKVEVAGVFESVNAHEVSANTEQFKSLVLQKVVPHGAIVKKGQAIVWFDSEAIDKQIENTEEALQLAEVAFQEASLNHKHAGAIHAIDVAAAKRTRRNAQQDFDNFNKVDLDRSIASNERSLENARFSLEYSEEDLKQLTQMYEEDDLTEQSEEIVLKRARRAVESARFYLEGAEIQAKRQKEQGIPRTAESQKEALDRSLLEFDRTMKALELAKQKRDLEFAAEQKKIAKQRDDLKQLRDDRQKLVLKAPIDGIVLHGKLAEGKAPAKPSTLEEGTSITDRQVVVTVVDPKKLRVRVELPENLLAKVTVGGKATVKPTAFPDAAFAGKVSFVSAIPISAGKFTCIVNGNFNSKKAAINPTMACLVQFETGDAKTEPNAKQPPARKKESKEKAETKKKVEAKGKAGAKKKVEAKGNDEKNDKKEAK